MTTDQDFFNDDQDSQGFDDLGKSKGRFISVKNGKFTTKHPETGDVLEYTEFDGRVTSVEVADKPPFQFEGKEIPATWEIRVHLRRPLVKGGTVYDWIMTFGGKQSIGMNVINALLGTNPSTWSGYFLARLYKKDDETRIFLQTEKGQQRAPLGFPYNEETSKLDGVPRAEPILLAGGAPFLKDGKQQYDWTPVEKFWLEQLVRFCGNYTPGYDIQFKHAVDPRKPLSAASAPAAKSTPTVPPAPAAAAPSANEHTPDQLTKILWANVAKIPNGEQSKEKIESTVLKAKDAIYKYGMSELAFKDLASQVYKEKLGKDWTITDNYTAEKADDLPF